ncbi:hypothetical protein [Mycoplasmopsis alligatoris]|nr:hypothetical protein [Mycoplasmopsis alligatoris]
MKAKKITKKLHSKKDIFKRLEVPFVENIPEENKVLHPKVNIPLEIIKFVLFNLIVVFFILMSQAKGTWLELIYQYSFGLLFGNLIYLFTVIGYLAFLVHFFSFMTKNKAFTYFSRLKKTSIFVIKKNCYLILASLFICLSLIEHMIYHFYYNPSFSFNTSNESLRSLFTNGWYARFNEDGPNVNNNIGFLLDTLYNILYYPTLSPILPGLLIITIIVLTFLQVFFNGIKKHFSYYSYNLPAKKLIKNLHHRNSMFYMTKSIELYFNFIIEAGKIMQLSVETVPFKKLQKSVLANLAKINYEIIIGQLFQEEAFSDSEKLIKSQTANITIDPINLKKKEEFDDDFFTTKEVEIKNKSEFVEFIEHDLEENKIGPDIRSAKAVDFKENGNINFSEQNQSNSNKSQPINNSNINKKNNIIKSQYNEKISDEFEFNEIEDTQIVDLNKNKNDSYLSNNSKINEPLNAVPQPNKEIMNDNILNKQIEPEKQTSHKISTKLSKVEEFLDSVFIGQSKEK